MGLIFDKKMKTSQEHSYLFLFRRNIHHNSIHHASCFTNAVSLQISVGSYKLGKSSEIEKSQRPLTEIKMELEVARTKRKPAEAKMERDIVKKLPRTLRRSRYPIMLSSLKELKCVHDEVTIDLLTISSYCCPLPVVLIAIPVLTTACGLLQTGSHRLMRQHLQISFNFLSSRLDFFI